MGFPRGHRYQEISNSANVIQRVQRRAHSQRHILPLVITREGDHFVRDVSVSPPAVGLLPY